jgi:DNA uptake protein ComE-like DNA-binding protein
MMLGSQRAWRALIVLVLLGFASSTRGRGEASTIPSSPPLALNRASLAELSALPGIGPELARRLRAGRPYERLADLQRIPGFGPRRVARLRGLLVVSR